VQIKTARQSQIIITERIIVRKSYLHGILYACAFVLAVLSAYIVSYTVIDLGTPWGDKGSNSGGIGGSGQVAGSSDISEDSSRHILLYDDNTK
jgi:hypothetical protein